MTKLLISSTFEDLGWAPTCTLVITVGI